MAAKYWLRTEGIEFEVSKTAVPKTDGKTQKIDIWHLIGFSLAD